MKIAIIGAGLAGLTLANRLAARHDVVVLEKARGPGGRMSTRRASPFAFDHGAQYFTAESPQFQAFVQDMRNRGLVEEWPKEIVLKGGARVSDKRKYVATPGMTAICKTLAEPVTVRMQVHASHLTRKRDGWWISPQDGAPHGPFDWVVSTAPAEQTAALLPDTFSGHPALRGVEMHGCFALMLGFEMPLDLNWTALKSAAPPIGWMAVDSNKPGRARAFSLLIQSNNAWAETHLDAAPAAVTETLLQVGSEYAGVDLSHANHQVLHRWRYASTPKPAGVPFLFDDDQQLAACGDWCPGSKVEAAFSSANALADQFQSMLKA